MKEYKYPLAPALIDSIKKDSFSLFGEISETILDASINEGIFKDIPVFSIFFKGYGIITNIRDRIFLKKIALFLKNSSSITEQEKKDFLEKMNREPHFKQRVGENLLLLLERHNDFSKSALLGIMFSSYMKLEITYNQFNRFANAIDILIQDDIEKIIEDEYLISEDLLNRLYKADLANILLKTGNTGEMNRRLRRSNDPDVPELRYVVNELGLLFIKIIRNNK